MVIEFADYWRLANFLLALSLMLRLLIRLTKQHDADLAWYLGGIILVLLAIVVGAAELRGGPPFGYRLPIATAGLCVLHYAVTRFSRKEKKRKRDENS